MLFSGCASENGTGKVLYRSEPIPLGFTIQEEGRICFLRHDKHPGLVYVFPCELKEFGWEAITEFLDYCDDAHKDVCSGREL